MDLLLQLIILFFVVFALSRAILRFKDKQLTWNELLFWSLVWVLVIVFIFLPALSDWIASFFGLDKGVNLLIYSSILFLFYLVFRLYVKIEKVEQNLTSLVREIGIDKTKKK